MARWYNFLLILIHYPLFIAHIVTVIFMCVSRRKIEIFQFDYFTPPFFCVCILGSAVEIKIGNSIRQK